MSTMAQLAARRRLYPVWLAEIALNNSGPTLYLSDRNIDVAGQRYENYIAEITGVGDELRRVDSTGLNSNISITFRNRKFKTYNYLVEINDTYPFAGANITLKQVYLDDTGAVSSDIATRFKGRIDLLLDQSRARFSAKLSTRLSFLSLAYN